MRIDVTPSSEPENYPREICGEQPSIPLFPLSEYNLTYGPMVSQVDRKDRFVIVEVEGKTVVVDVAAPINKSFRQ